MFKPLYVDCLIAHSIVISRRLTISHRHWQLATRDVNVPRTLNLYCTSDVTRSNLVTRCQIWEKNSQSTAKLLMI